MYSFKEVKRTEQIKICDKCKKPFDTPLGESESIHIERYDFHKECLLEIIKKELEK